MPEPSVPPAVVSSPVTEARPPSSLRRAILLHLRRSGPSSPDAIAAALGASRSGVAAQMRALDAAGLVSRSAVRHGVGRPRHVYDVTADAQDLFPSGYDALATGLLAAILEVGGDDLLRDVFAARRRQAAAAIRQRLDDRAGPAASLPARVRELAVLQDELGYLADVELDDGAVRLVQHNCAVAHVAAGTAAACEAELDLFRDVLGADVSRERHLASGDRCCAYRIASPES